MIIERSKSYLVVNKSIKSDDEILREIVKSQNISNSDVICFDNSQGVLDLRKKISSVIMKPHSSASRLFAILNGGSLNGEQANALLKIFEEPPRYAILLIFTRNPSLVLPTIRSRCVQVIYQGGGGACTDSVFLKYLEKNFNDFLKFIASLESDEIPDMLKNALECIKKNEGSQRDLRLFQDISKAYLRLCSTNSNAKMALEYIYISNKASKARKKT